jgi:hypothetical protein
MNETMRQRPRPVLFIDFTNTTSAKSVQHSSIDRYREILQQYYTSYYEHLYFGFNYFSEGTMIDSWMRDEAMLEPVQERKDGTLLYSANSYTRIDFQERVYKDP